MNLPAARALIQRCNDRMRSLYGREVFDEWAVVQVGNTGAMLAAYEGPRLEQFRSAFVADATHLRELLRGRSLAVGEFAFAPAAAGTAFDATICIGLGAYLLFNDTRRTMDEIRADPRWLDAQRPFVELTEAFRQDPLA